MSLVVYTTIIGDGYKLPQINTDDSAKYVCFTDQRDLDANGWSLYFVDTPIPNDLPRSSREFKIRPHVHLKEFSRSIYVDPSVGLKKSAEDTWAFMIQGDAVFSCFHHSHRASLADEMRAVAELQLDSGENIVAVINEIKRRSLTDLLAEPIYWGGFLARRHNDSRCSNAMEEWFKLILETSRRDQLTLPLALRLIPQEVRTVVSNDIHQSDFHQWPLPGYTRPQRYYENK